MEKEVRLKYSLAIVLSLFLIFNSVLVWLASRGHPLISAQDTLPIGIKWLFVLGAAVLSVAIAYWAHIAFLKGGVSPVDTTWVDFAIIAYVLMTIFLLLFVGQAFWLLFALFLFLLFVFSAFVLRKLLESNKAWVGWLLITIVLSVLMVILTSTILPIA
jgi:hypothetical protein